MFAAGWLVVFKCLFLCALDILIFLKIFFIQFLEVTFPFTVLQSISYILHVVQNIFESGYFNLSLLFSVHERLHLGWLYWCKSQAPVCRSVERAAEGAQVRRGPGAAPGHAGLMGSHVRPA